jgi:hypothetical protein
MWGFVAGNDTSFPAEQHPLDLEAVVENDDVCCQPDVQMADVRLGNDAGGHRGGRRQRVLERHAESVEIANRLDHRQQ